MRTKLAKAKTGYYEVRWSEGGRSKTVSTRTKDLVEAKAFRAAWHNALRTGQGDATGVGRVTVNEVCQAYLDHHCRVKGRMDGQMWSLKPVRAFFGPLAPRDINAVTVQDYTTDRGGKVKPGTIRRELGTLIAALNWGARQKMIPREDVPSIAKPPEGAARRTFLDEASEADFYAAAMADSAGEKRLTRLTRFVALALDTAARKEAIEGLTWDRVDLVRGTIDFRDPAVRSSRKKRVVVPISARLAPVLKQARQEATGRYVLDHGGDIRTTYETFVAREGFSVNIHDLRRTWATLALRAGVDPWSVAGVLGDSIATVMKNYAVHSIDHLSGAVNARFAGKD